MLGSQSGAVFLSADPSPNCCEAVRDAVVRLFRVLIPTRRWRRRKPNQSSENVRPMLTPPRSIGVICGLRIVFLNQGTRQNRAILHLKAVAPWLLLQRTTPDSAGFSDDFRENGRCCNDARE